MKVSLNTVKQLIDFELPPVAELVERINAQLGGVEEVIDLGARYKGGVIVRVIHTERHPNADKLSVCLVDDGGVVDGVERNEDSYVTVVCGAPNVHADMWAIWLPPNTTVPASFDDAEPFVLTPKELRGIVSNGMLAAGDELAINSDHDGIIELTDADLSPELEGRGLAAGQDFAELFGLDDTIIDIENKMFTHRPDCFGQLGVAREIAGIFGHTFHDPQWYYQLGDQISGEGLELTTFNDAGDRVPRLMLVAMRDVSVRPSPLWLQTTLLRWGGKAINNIVDITNYIMYFTAQPTHCYDYDKLRGHTIGARMAREGEELPLLNGKTYTLTPDDIVIADGEGAIGLGGVMGGANSEVSPETKNIVLEVASFDMYTVRKSSMRYGLFTDALTRFNKGQSFLMNPFVQQHAVELLEKLADAVPASDNLDDMMVDDKTWRAKPTVCPMMAAETITPSFINDRLGSSLTVDEIITMLEHVGFDCTLQGDAISYWAPAWRMDIQDREDVVEEVGRLYGFDSLPRELPRRSTAPAPRNEMRALKQRVRESLSMSGANEVLTYSFIHQNVMTRAEQDAAQAFRLSNALSPDLQYYRLSVLPSLLDKVHMNIKLGFDEFTLFEIGKGHTKQHIAEDDSLPVELEFVDAVYTSKKPLDGAPYFHMRRLAEQLARDLGFAVKFVSVTDTTSGPVTAPFELSRSAFILSRQDEFIGIVGELKQSVRKSFKLPDCTAAMSLDLSGLKKATDTPHQPYAPLSRFPSTSQDISLKTPVDVSYEALFHAVWEELTQQAHGIDVMISPVSIYQSDTDATTKTTTFHISFTSHDKTLSDKEIVPLIDSAAVAAAAQLHAELV